MLIRKSNPVPNYPLSVPSLTVKEPWGEKREKKEGSKKGCLHLPPPPPAQAPPLTSGPA